MQKRPLRACASRRRRRASTYQEAALHRFSPTAQRPSVGRCADAQHVDPCWLTVDRPRLGAPLRAECFFRSWKLRVMRVHRLAAGALAFGSCCTTEVGDRFRPRSAPIHRRLVPPSPQKRNLRYVTCRHSINLNPVLRVGLGLRSQDYSRGETSCGRVGASDKLERSHKPVRDMGCASFSLCGPTQQGSSG